MPEQASPGLSAISLKDPDFQFSGGKKDTYRKLIFRRKSMETSLNSYRLSDLPRKGPNGKSSKEKSHGPNTSLHYT